jgi:hypothetical protein
MKSKTLCNFCHWGFIFAFLIGAANAAFADELNRTAGSAATAKLSTDTAQKPYSVLAENDIVAYYGHPNSEYMGILGRYPIDELYEKLSAEAENYATVSGGRGIKKAFYIIFGTVWPEGEIGIIGEETLLKWIDFAQKHDMLIFLDHQLGRYDPEAAAARMFKYLKYPNVHLAIDPEWRTTKPMQEIGSVTADEINRIQKAMENYLVTNDLPDERMLVIHQFKPWMIVDRDKITASSERVRLVHCADGFGNPAQKRGSYAANAEAANIPVKGFKLFYKSFDPRAGFDEPILTPADVYALNPRPQVIMYQ